MDRVHHYNQESNSVLEKKRIAWGASEGMDSKASTGTVHRVGQAAYK